MRREESDSDHRPGAWRTRRVCGQDVLVPTRRSRTPLTARDIAGEALCLAGGGRALLLQIAHPAIGRGVTEHSDFANRMLDRLNATMTFLYASVYGTPEELRFVRESVDRAHGPVRAEAEKDAPAYDAFDPALQLWVAATLYQTMIDLHERIFGPVTRAHKDRLYREFSLQLSVLQLPPETWPPTREAFDGYWDSMLDGLATTDATRAIARQILYPQNVPAWMRAVLPLARLVTVGLLPDTVRKDFRLAWNDRVQRRFDGWMRNTARLYPLLPTRIRHAPRAYYLRRLRAIMRDHGVRPAGPTAP